MIARALLLFAALPFVGLAASSAKWCEVSPTIDAQLKPLEAGWALTPARRAAEESLSINCSPAIRIICLSICVISKCPKAQPKKITIN